MPAADAPESWRCEGIKVTGYSSGILAKRDLFWHAVKRKRFFS